MFDALRGVVVRIEDGLDLDLTTAPSFRASDCRPPNARGVIRCRSADGKLDGSLTPTAPQSPVWLFKINLRQIATPPASYGPVMVTLTHGLGVDRVGTLSSCRATTGGLSCVLP